MDPSPKCIIPVTMHGNVYDFILRSDRHYSRIPLDIWRDLSTALTPLPSKDASPENDDDFSGCLGFCVTDLSILAGNLSDHSVLVSRERTPTLGLSTLIALRLVFDFGNGRFHLESIPPTQDMPKLHEEPQYSPLRRNRDQADSFRDDNVHARPTGNATDDVFEARVDRFLDACRTGNFVQVHNKEQHMASSNREEFSDEQVDRRLEYPASRDDRRTEFPGLQNDRRRNFPADLRTEFGNEGHARLLNERNMDFFGDRSPEVESIHERHVEFRPDIQRGMFRNSEQRFNDLDLGRSAGNSNLLDRSLEIRIQENLDLQARSNPRHKSNTPEKTVTKVYQRFLEKREQGFQNRSGNKGDTSEVHVKDSISVRINRRGKRGGARSRFWCTHCRKRGHTIDECLTKDTPVKGSSPAGSQNSPWESWVTKNRK